MKNHSYDEASVIRSLNRKQDVRVSSINKTIEVSRNTVNLGNGSWGKIDYLRKVHHYLVLFVDKTITKKVNTEHEEKQKLTKTAKREAKLNMAANVKAAMRKFK